MDNIKTWTGLPVEESIRMTEDRDKWSKYVHGVANPRIEDGYRTEQNYYSRSTGLFSRTRTPLRWLGSRVVSVLDLGAEGPGFKSLRWLGSRVVSVLDLGAEGPGFKSQP